MFLFFINPTLARKAKEERECETQGYYFRQLVYLLDCIGAGGINCAATNSAVSAYCYCTSSDTGSSCSRAGCFCSASASGITSSFTNN